ncbi:MAG: hypothetical protein Q9190_005832, partial [Brigantiaea leucoxantha]
MSALSSLLNPAPSSDTPQELEASQHPAAELQIQHPHTKEKTPDLAQIKIGSPGVQPSIKSPLDALAEVATSSAPLRSPTNLNGAHFAGLDAHANTSTSRPSSSRISPPTSYENTHGSGPTSPSFTSELQQYHHPTRMEPNGPRLSSEDLKARLPRFRPSISDISMAMESILPDIRSPGEDLGPKTLPGIGDTLGQTSNILYRPRDPAMTSQIRQPSPGPSIPANSSNLPPTQSEQAEVKTEMVDIPAGFPPAASEPIGTPAEFLRPTKKESETPAKLSPTPINNQAEATPPKSKAASARKRPPPKKGTAKSTAKKRKLEMADNLDNTSPTHRTQTPNSSRAGKDPASRSRKQNSTTPLRSSPTADEDEDDDEGGVFCICRGPDDHSWMIACDGPCEDWYHGRCVGMKKEQGDLIEKYYCKVTNLLQYICSVLIILTSFNIGPNCTANGEGQTLWKPMCRLEGCDRPARVNGPNRSKYCSDSHGVEFMRREAMKLDGQAELESEVEEDRTEMSDVIASQKRTNRRKNNYTDHMGNNEEAIQLEAQADAKPDLQRIGIGTSNASVNSQNTNRKKRNFANHIADGKDAVPSLSEQREGTGDGRVASSQRPGGGVLRTGELKTLAEGAKDFQEFCTLGNALPSPPAGVTANGTGITDVDKPTYTIVEKLQLDAFAAKRTELRARKSMLDDRDTFISLVKERAARVLDILKKKDEERSKGDGSVAGGKKDNKKGAGKKDGLIKDICGYD